MIRLNVTLIFILVCLATSADAQNRYTIRLSGNLGGGASIEDTYISGRSRQSSDVSFLGNLSAGYTISKFRLNAGVGLMGTSYSEEYKGLIFEENFDPVTGLPTTVTPADYTVYFIYRYAVLPITAGYVITFSDRLNLVPEVGLMPAYNLPLLSKIENETKGTVRTYNIPAERTFSLSGIMSLNVEYYLTAHVGLTVGATYTRMFTNLMDRPANALYNAYHREYTYGGGIGVAWRF
ncbi:MAG: outer membrane beta-barrel protein [Taibaiella sp.]|nr:outer membrane beta-barrel protein [Taibaiella sp.]